MGINRWHRVAGLGLSALLLLAPAQAAELDRCERNLKHIYSALERYRELNGVFPDALGELLPKYLADPSSLRCPLTSATGENSMGQDDFTDASDGLSTYAFEIGGNRFMRHGGKDLTFGQVKSIQRSAIGDAVPVLRCFRHGRALNMPFSGRLYRSERYWEISHTRERGMPYLLGPLLFKYPNPLHTYLRPKG